MEDKKAVRSKVFYPGMVIGNWTILEVFPYDMVRHSRQLLCRCACGSEKLIRSNNIRRTVSCGCTRKRVDAAHVFNGRTAVGTPDPPDCPGCTGCGRADRINCSDYKHCEKWRSWFHEEWTAIRNTFGKK